MANDKFSYIDKNQINVMRALFSSKKSKYFYSPMEKFQKYDA